jgi:O-6-methylguanine DNA methyltransferase
MPEPEELRHVSERKQLFEQVYSLTTQIPYGRVSTYGALGLALEPVVSPRIIGYIMSICPYPNDKVPCHRVIKSDGKIGGFGEGPHGVEKKISLLEEEGVPVIQGKVDLAKFFFDDFRARSVNKKSGEKSEDLTSFV